VQKGVCGEAFETEGFDMKLKLLGIVVGSALSTACWAHSAQAFTLFMDQNPNPFQAFEDTAGNIGFLTISNFGSSDITITSITGVITPFSGELDDQATNLKLLAPTNFPILLPAMVPGMPLSNFNIKFSWDAVDTTKDNDVDFGVWHASFTLIGSQAGKPPTDVAFAVLRVNDTPLPAALPLFATGLGALGLLGWRTKRKAQAGLNFRRGGNFVPIDH
jgi:hypothetical protein